MVVSQIVDTIQYSENKNIENMIMNMKFHYTKTNYMILVIALGKQNNKYKKYDIIYAPMYLVLDEKKIYFK